MGKVTFNISVSLDGFVAGPNDEVDKLFEWYFSGDKEIPVQEGRFVLKVSEESAKLLDETQQNTGAMVAGRRMFDLAKAWNGTPPFTPCFIVTHTVPEEWVREGSPFIFVTDGVETAIDQAKKAAGEKDVVIATPQILVQGLKAGLVDEIAFDLVPVLLGRGVRMFDGLGDEPIQLENTRTIRAPGVTHLAYRVIKEG